MIDVYILEILPIKHFVSIKIFLILKQIGSSDGAKVGPKSHCCQECYSAEKDFLGIDDDEIGALKVLSYLSKNFLVF